MTQRLRQGDSLIVFPEATTTVGLQVNRFFPHLFDAAIAAHRPVEPLALRYLTPQGDRDPIAPFVDDDTLDAHLWRLLAVARTRAELTPLPLLTPPFANRRTLATASHGAIQAVIPPPPAL